MRTGRNGPRMSSRAPGRYGPYACSTGRRRGSCRGTAPRPGRAPWPRKASTPPAGASGSPSGTNGLGLALGITAFALLTVSATLYSDAWHIVSFTVFGLTLLLLYGIYTLYHSWRSEPGKQFFLKLARASVFLLVAGTYTPFLLVSLRGPWGWSLFGVVWGLCGAGAVFQFFGGHRYRVTSTLATLFVGWMVVVAIKPVCAAVPHGGLWLLLAGGLCYTAGAFLAALRRLRYHYVLRNALVIGGSTCHFLAVLLFVLPQHV